MLSAAGLHNLDKVEIRDARGTWSVVRTGAQVEAPPGCRFVRLTQAFASGKREVDALRITIRPGRDSIVVSDAGLTKAD